MLKGPIQAGLAVLALAAASGMAFASSASAGTATVANACANSVTPNFSQIGVTTSGDDGVNFATPGQALSESASQSAAIPGAIFVAGYNLGLLVVGVNNVPANVRSTIEATNTVEGSQNTNTVGGVPPNGTVSVTTTITDPDGTPGTGDETATDASFSVTYNNLSWTAGASGTIDYRQQSIAVAPPTAANNALLINALVGGVFNVQFRCAPGTVTPPDPGTITLIDPAPSFDTTMFGGPPIANAGPDQAVNEGSLVTLDASASTDPDPDETLTYSWTQISGTQVTLSDPTAVMPTFTAPSFTGTSADNLVFQLQVCDQASQCSTDTVTITVIHVDVSILIGEASATEGGAETFTVSLSSPSAQAVTVDFATADGTAVAPGDYTSNSGTVTFAPGVTSQTVTVQTIDDVVFEGGTGTFETFDVNLSNPTNSTIADGLGVGSIEDNDPPLLATGIVIVNGPVSSTKTRKSFVFKVSNFGIVPITLNESNITEESVGVNGTATGTVAVTPFTKTLNPGASTRVKLVWSYSAGSLLTGDSVVFHACLTLPGDPNPTDDCDDAARTAG
jgi:K319L-like, PKD domain